MSTDLTRMSSEKIQEANLRESSDQSVQMQQLLPMELQAIEQGYSVSDDLNSIIPYATLRMRNVARLSNEECANAIANHLQSSDKFMQDDPESEQFRMETVRTIPQCLNVKRSVKSQLMATVNRKTIEKSISCWKLFRYNVSLKSAKIWMTIRNLLTIKLWHRTIKTIESHHGSGIATYFKFLRWLLFLNTICCVLSVSFIVIPQSLAQTHVPNNIEVLDFLTGNGFLSHTIMYYGFYSNGTVDAPFGPKYSIPFAYFLTLLFCYIVTFVALSRKVISSYRKSYVETRGKVHNMYSSKIFCGWDFSISSPKTAALQSASIYKELEELLAEMIQDISLHWCAKCLLIITQLAVTSIVIFIICGAGALIWMLLSHYGLKASVTVSVVIVPVVITAIIHVFPTIISYLASLEHYSNKRTELYVTVVRNYAVAATIIGTLFVFWIINSTSHCWQTHLGKEIYRLIILDFIASLFGASFHFARSVLYYKGLSTKVGRPEFDIARNTLNLIYNQTLFWIGFYFSPLTSVMIVIKLIFTFYAKRYELKRYYQRPSQPWRAAQTQTLFLALAFLSITTVLYTIGYVITNVKSDECGPFRDHFHTWDFIVDRLLSLKRDSPFWSFVSKLASPVTGAVILIAMCIAVYCLRAKAEASKEMLQILSDMLLLQSQDKQFLIKSFGKCAKNKHTAQHAGFAEQNRRNEGVLLSRRRNLPSTSFEEMIVVNNTY
ncbi:PREDICTED: transmembrane channel-like protein 5 isoform X1 [Wasmannia auropunctata]|uniref:transmembrane channel-like protein 5 isoform X1 n=1 Tax=Wasmannia auropunctata TaxID=64793 RepID=UPI0005EEBA4A|nr:PREDICTED: transmembrane channel-like protein 5 isoform X1 [Wasmannia auropunctata]XP_011700126.1 PREDICTED: transmembrane channel-like protein 5 isoform X1 [Wasmannia auropunctata]XP_011700127.1 PREDICTED: transmembrane channel-like protein 5 isoform X1 [Wasmannia auropunctata]XP_011700128.1 PREDICTED: transmembrane channel-like protein 5 isoform X1 [Wasmannia auropunctata]